MSLKAHNPVSPASPLLLPLLLLLCPPPQPSNLDFKPKIQPRGSNSNLKAHIPASSLKFQPKSLKSSLKPRIHTQTQNPALRLNIQPHGPNFSLQAQIVASRLQSQHKASKITKHRSSAPSGPLPLSPSHIHTHSQGQRVPLTI